MSRADAPSEHPGPSSCDGWVILAGDESGDYEERDVDAEPTAAERGAAELDGAIAGLCRVAL